MQKKTYQAANFKGKNQHKSEGQKDVHNTHQKSESSIED